MFPVSRYVSLFRRWKLSAIILLTIYSITFFPFWDLNNVNITVFDVVPEISSTILIFHSVFILAVLSDFHYSIFQDHLCILLYHLMHS